MQTDQKGSFVLCREQQEQDRAARRETGTVTPNGLAISGLTGNERVVQYAAGFLNPGETVKIKVVKPGTAR